MSRRRTLLASSVLVAGLGLVAPMAGHAAPPAGSCFGTGSATLSNGIAYPPNFSSLVGFTFTFNCATGGSVTGTGTLSTAACGTSSGTGTVVGIGDFTLETAGSMLLVTGVGNNLAGGGNATPIPNTSTVPPTNSCSNGTATNFTLVGGLTW